MTKEKDKSIFKTGYKKLVTEKNQSKRDVMKVFFKRILHSLTILFSLFSISAQATHVWGGELEASCDGSGNYTFSLTQYVSCDRVAGMAATYTVKVFNKDGTENRTLTLNATTRDTLPTVPNACAKTVAGTCIGRIIATGTTKLPLNTDGYILSYSSCCRNSSIENLVDPANTSQIYNIELPGSDNVTSCNSSPTFNSLPPSEICTNLPAEIDFSASDADGDVLKYKFVQPYGSTSAWSTDPTLVDNASPPFDQIIFSAGYAFDNPMNSGLTIDENTGIITGTPKASGLFALGVVVEEYRGGVLIGRKVRDYTYTVVPCIPTLSTGEPSVLTCADEPVYFSFDFDGILKAGTTPIWDFGDPASSENSSTLFDPNHKYTALGSYIATVTIEDSCGNKLNDSIKVDIVETIANVKGPDDVCKGDNITLTCTDNPCDLTEWYDSDTSTTPIHVSCTYDFVLAAEEECIYFEPFVDPNDYIVGATGEQGWGTDVVNATTFDAITPLTIEGFTLMGDQYWDGCANFNAMITVEQSGTVIAGPEFLTVDCDGETVFSGLALNIPQGTGYELKVSGATVRPGTGGPVNQVGLIRVNPGGPFYNINVHSNQKCARRDSICFVSNCPCPDTSLTFPPNFCANQNFDLNTLKTTATSPGSWSIKSSPTGTNPALIENDSIFKGDGVDAGVYTIFYKVEGTWPGCITENEREIEIYSVDSAKILDQVTFCELETRTTVELSSTSTTGGAWSSSTAGYINNATGIFDPSGSGPGTHWLFYNSPSLNCPAKDSIEITVFPSKEVDIITPDTTVCVGSDNFVIRTSSNTDVGTWSGTSITDSLFTPSTSGTFKIFLKANGATTLCSDSDSVIITVTQMDTVKITPDQGPFCRLGGTVNLKLDTTSVVGYWTSNTTGAITTDGIFDPLTADLGVHLVKYTSGGSCPIADSVNIEVIDALSAQIALPDTTVCLNSSSFIINKSAGVANGGKWIGNVTDSLFTPSTPGTFKIKYVLEGLTAACSDSNSIEITVLPNINALITPPTPSEFCTGDTAILLSNADTSNTGMWWSSPTGKIGNDGTFNPSTSGVGDFKIFYGTSGMCGDTSDINLTVHRVKDPTITPLATYCEIAEDQTLKAVETGSWTINDLPNDSIFSPSKLGPGIHKVINSINDKCPVADTILVEVKPNPASAIDADTLEGCYPMEVTFEDLSDSNALSTVWTIMQEVDTIFETNKLNSLEYVFSTAGCYDVSIASQYEYGCANTTKLPYQICTFSPPTADFLFESNDVTTKDPKVTAINQSTDGNIFTWNYNGGRTIFENEETVMVDYNTNEQDTVDITLYASNGWCIDSITKSIIIWDFFTLNVPNAFIPNGDGMNELFYPMGKNHVADDFVFMIFNRWGDKIFETTTPYTPWDGTSQLTGNPVQEDVYVWKVVTTDIFENEVVRRTGTVALIR